MSMEELHDIITVNLSLPEKTRWQDVIDDVRAEARAVADQAAADFSPLFSDYSPVPWAFKKVIKVMGGYYQGEIKAWADAIHRPASHLTLLNHTYEISHLTGRLFGCTAGVVQTKEGPVLVRNMDWPLSAIGPATRIVRFKKGSRELLSASIGGFTGVLSGMVPGKFAVTMNWAYPTELPRFDWSPSVILREAMLEAESYDDLVKELSEATLSTSVFFTVCGTKPSQACVIERTRHKAHIRTKQPVLVTNHYSEWAAYNKDPEILEFSKERYTCLSAALTKNATIKTPEACLDDFPVLHEATFQQMAFCPKTRDFRVWAEMDPDAEE